MSNRLVPEIPFPEIKYILGEGVHPAKSPAGTIQDKAYADIRFKRGFAFAIDLFNAGYYWEVHEFLERFWHKEESKNIRLVIQILIQLSALAIKKIQNQPGGVPGLLQAIEQKLATLFEQQFYEYRGLDLRKFKSWIENWEKLSVQDLVLEV